jgi:hypothetical protein
MPSLHPWATTHHSATSSPPSRACAENVASCGHRQGSWVNSVRAPERVIQGVIQDEVIDAIE